MIRLAALTSSLLALSALAAAKAAANSFDVTKRFLDSRLKR